MNVGSCVLYRYLLSAYVGSWILCLIGDKVLANKFENNVSSGSSFLEMQSSLHYCFNALR